MPINIDRIRSDFQAIARCTATPGQGATRPTFSPAWADARAYVIAQAEAAGCAIRTDAAGNLHARPNSVPWETPAWLVGSHIDSVPHGGDYDGVTGVVVALELLRSAREVGIDAAVELIVFAEEEGPTFGLGMLGSRAWVGELTADQLGQLKNAAGQTYLEAGQPYGVDPAKLEIDRLIRSRYLGLLEVHIEQGPAMWKNGVPLAVVTDIAGRRQYKAKFMGVPNHAGSTAMGDRTDALVPAARVITFVEEMARGFGGATVATVGHIECSPNAVNVVPGTVRFTIDFRSPDGATLAAGHEALQEFVIRSADAPAFNFLTMEEQPPVPMDAQLCRQLSAAAERVLGHPVPTTVSGALHDSAILAAHIPTAMLFIPSKDGISHNPAEFSRVEDIADAAHVVERLVRRPTIGQLNAMSNDNIVRTIGHVFEDSSWIVERACDGRPFSSLNDLYDKLCVVVASATPDEKLSLIRAHPDLVGRLAREGRLTRESTAEQAAAGLTALTEEEAAQFARYNQAYRERFGFPFVICARENKKDAILAAFPQRLGHDRDREIATALEEIYKITRLRLADAIWEIDSQCP